MVPAATIVVSPRDRYSGVTDCIKGIYEHTDPTLFKLIVLDLGYPRALINEVREYLRDKNNSEVIEYGRVIPMEGMRRVRDHIDTPYTVFLDNDSRVTAGWLPPLLETAGTGAATVSPLTLEKAGVDEGAELRNHIFTSEIRVVDVNGEPYLIEHKPYRRALPEDLPDRVTPTQLFELHCVLFNTRILQSLELPQMVIREHIDIGMQLQKRGEKLLAEPRSVIYFDNLGTRMTLTDMLYFNFRWGKKLTYQSSRLFEQRWGYKFYSEQSIYNWVVRRRLFLICRWLYLSIPMSNKLCNIFNKFKTMVFPIWDPLRDPVDKSTLYYETLENGKPAQKNGAIYL